MRLWMSTFSKICISKAWSSLHLASFGDDEALSGDDDDFISKSNFFCQSSVDLGCPAEGFWLASPGYEDSSSSTTCIARTGSTFMQLNRCSFPHVNHVRKVKL
ncbi:hypothetical protein HanRHA438_Chr11g0519211 [Helianthus annuus]|uniref:Uncharacterized protein n=1 Tax=Helianthus annuus TaxID=4232 RepID=A0A251TD45_HELAN|nr:hypothetical protein HanXRQr2_Chr11g0506711 [Helianthus annuus]KAJ0518622.1 hypothetical protein HanHA89_Chr11g0439531 [Helianthus annuus]KAJ0686666.1 hypothetical protein HanLR1_Chr11g0417301 [Helianthus annuus]KAJ0690479.1 hypothetical protein HanOQP8_Chr11g0418291 [Helianthus annuus]KAJ0872035.1 hypothetical protein HanRHA438_Chr11g0519211 [Helianthus annuus]